MTNQPIRPASPAPTSEELAAQLQVSPSEVAAWQKALDARAPRRPLGRKAMLAALVALVAVSALWSRTGATAGCPDPVPPLPAGMTKFCPDTPAVAQDVNQNFASLVAWLEKCAGGVGGIGAAALPIPSDHIKSANIQDKAVSGAHFANSAVTIVDIQDGSLQSKHVTDGSIAKAKIDVSAGTTPLYLSDPACSGGREQWVSTESECRSAPCPNTLPCAPGFMPYYKCGGTFCDVSVCLPAPSNAGGYKCPMTQISGRLIK